MVRRRRPRGRRKVIRASKFCRFRDQSSWFNLSTMSVLPALSLAVAAAFASQAFAEDLKIGMVGLDTSHVIAFTKLMNDAGAPNHVPGAKVVAAVKTSSPDIPSSAD